MQKGQFFYGIAICLAMLSTTSLSAQRVRVGLKVGALASELFTANSKSQFKVQDSSEPRTNFLLGIVGKTKLSERIDLQAELLFSVCPFSEMRCPNKLIAL